MAQFQRIKKPHAGFFNNCHSHVALFSSDETPIESLIPILNMYFSEVLRIRKMGVGFLHVMLDLNSLCEKSIAVSTRNTRLCCEASVFFEYPFQCSMNYIRKAIELHPIEIGSHLLIGHIINSQTHPVGFEYLLADAKKNPDERVLYYLKYIDGANEDRTATKWTHQEQQVRENNQIFQELRRNPSSFVAIIPWDLVKYVIEPYLTYAYRYFE